MHAIPHLQRYRLWGLLTVKRVLKPQLTGRSVKRRWFQQSGAGQINRCPSQSKHNSNRSRAQIKRREREKSSVRAKVEHVFAVVKQLLYFRKTRYRGLRKQTAKLNILFALANLILADRPCLAAWVSAHMRTFWETFRSLFTVGFSFCTQKVICAVLP